MDRELERLRKELGAIDRQILELAARRQRLSSEIGRAKRQSGFATRDYRQEREVIERARRHADELGLTGELAESLLVPLIRSSLTVQEREGLAHSGGGSGKKALIVGGSGRMGRWFVGFLDSQGFEVQVADPEDSDTRDCDYRDWRDAGEALDIIVLACPLKIANAILLEMAERPPKALVFDIGSLKSPLRQGLAALAETGARVTSIHPMFGPDTELLSGRHVIFVDVGNREATAQAREIFGSTMAVQVSMDLESHDRLIAYVLGLSHALNLVFVTALAESGEAAPKLATMSSTTFDEQLRVARNVAAESPSLYFEIQSLNDYGTESLSALLYAVERLRSVVRADDDKAFAELMARGRSYLGSLGSEAANE